jgi:hypothetical protein
MFRPRPNAAGGPSKDGAVVQGEVSPSASAADGVAVDSPTTLPTGTGEESFISKMMADK